MPATADNLHDLHLLHQRAKALRDRLASGPRTLAARQAALATKNAEFEQAKKVLQDSKVQLKKHEHSLQSIDTKIDDFKVKLNQVKKNEEYKAIQNQIAHDNASKSKIEEDILQFYEIIETKTAELKKLEDDDKRTNA
jgi:predicted  nucleic acid-binding Zn-ribbon protein